VEEAAVQSPPSTRRVNVHVRVAGWPNQRYALLFRDYLRVHPRAAACAGLRRALAERLGNDLASYTEVKDHACDLIVVAAEDWAAASRVGHDPELGWVAVRRQGSRVGVAGLSQAGQRVGWDRRLS
jgi:hypothetical protein